MSSSSSSSSSSLVTGPTKWLKEMKWNNSALQELPIDKETKNVPRQVPNACFSMVKPTPVVKPTLIAYRFVFLKKKKNFFKMFVFLMY